MNKKFSASQMYITALNAFAYTVLITSIFRAIFSGGVMPVTFIWQMAGVAVITALLQSLFFTTRLVKRVGYPLRVFGFLACLLGALSAFAYFGSWFPAGLLINWVIFIVSFLVMGGIVTVLITLYYSRKARDYTARLHDYQNGEK